MFKYELSENKILFANTNEAAIFIPDYKIEFVKEHIYLGHTIMHGKENRSLEIKRRIALTWTAFGKL